MKYQSKWEVRRALLFVILSSVLAPLAIFAQFEGETECGFIIELSGFQDGFLDCDNPFDAAAGSAPHSIFLAGTLLGDDAILEQAVPLETNILVSPAGTETLEALALYRKEGENYQAVALAEVVEGQQYDVTLESLGEYVFVFNRSSGDEVAHRPLLPFITIAHAQEETEEGSTVYVKRFTVVSAEPEPTCGFLLYSETLQLPIEDCAQPFGLEQANPDLELRFADRLIEAGGSYSFLDQTDLFNATGTVENNTEFILDFALWQHAGENRIRVHHTLDDSFTFNATGTYTAVVTEDFRPVVSQSWWRTLLARLIPATHAAAGDRSLIEFTVIEPEPEPAGASSVLFLPGIQASRLYTDGIFGTEDRLWEPNSNLDVLQLAMDEQGNSIESVYTRDILLSIFGFDDIYRSFANSLDDLVAEDVIEDWLPFAYDWRYSVFDVVSNGTQYENEIRNPITEIEQLAAASKSGQVTLIGHSNGGLLAKAIMLELEQQNKADLVDRILLMATPQLGTPKAIGTILHGYDQEDVTGGYFVDDAVARPVIKNLPGAYGLLPSQAYFEATNNLIVSFDASDVTAPFRSAYGNAINDVDELEAFMNGSDGRAAPETVTDAATANAVFLADAISQHENRLDTWQAPAGVEVIEIVGVGLDTVSGFEYTEFTERICGEPDVFGTRDCAFETFYEPIPFISSFGDETVMGQSAEGYSGEKSTYYVDLAQIKLAAEVNLEQAVSHADFGETESVQTLVRNLITGTTSASDFISTNRPVYTESRLLLGSHSPVSMMLIDAAGNQTGIFLDETAVLQQREEIPDSTVLRLGDTTYVVVPAETDFETIITGEDEGGMTLTIHALAGMTQSLLHKTAVATITASTSISIQKNNDTIGYLEIDEDGDGEVDTILDLEGEVVVAETASYQLLRTQIKALNLSRSRELLYATKLAERFGQKADRRVVFARLEDRFLQKVGAAIARHAKRGRITATAAETITVTIELLKNVR